MSVGPGAIALLRPLVQAGLVPTDYPISIHAVSGYSGGGRAAVQAYEGLEAANALPFHRRIRRLPITELGCAGGAMALTHSADIPRGQPDAVALVPFPVAAVLSTALVAALPAVWVCQRKIIAPQSDPTPEAN